MDGQVYRLGDVVILENGCKGRIVGICEYLNQETRFCIRATTNTGRLYEEWWPADAFTHVQ